MIRKVVLKIATINNIMDDSVNYSSVSYDSVRCVSNDYVVYDSPHLEYNSAIQLIGLASKYISIPSSLILDKDMDSKRIAIFSYFRIIKGLDDIVRFTIPSLVKWCKLKPDTRSNGVSQKFIDTISDLGNRGYLISESPLNELSKTAYTECEFNSDMLYDKCQNESFAVIYLDELNAIMNYQKNDSDKYLNNAILLLVFTFFRNAIFNRPNCLRPEERNIDGTNNNANDVEMRKKRNPEAYANTYVEIGEQLGLTPRMVSKAVTILEKDLGLLVTDEAYHVRNDNGEFRTQYTLFANTYKRENGVLFANGENYSRNEIERKAEQISQYNERFIIDKSKRKNKK